MKFLMSLILLLFSVNSMAWQGIPKMSEITLEDVANEYDNCGGNYGSYVKEYVVDNFSFKDAYRDFKAEDKKSGCMNAKYTKTAQKTLARYYSLVALNNYKVFESDTAECVNYFVKPEYKEKWNEIVEDKNNLAVLSSSYSRKSSDISESCAYYRFKVYRKDGKVLNINFNYTD